MTALPVKTSISDTYPNPSNATARAGFAQLWDVISETIEKPELDLASATTCDIGGQLSTKLRITGATTITSFGTNYRGPILLRTEGALTITHNSTTLICPGNANLITTAGGTLIAWPKSTTSGIADGWQICNIGASTLGVGQTWQSVSRAGATTYTNSTGRSIMISASVSSSSAGATAMVVINGTLQIYGSTGSVSGELLYVSAIIPPGATYRVTVTAGTPTTLLGAWAELR